MILILMTVRVIVELHICRFLGFMVFFAGMMIAFIGIVKISNSRHQWNIFYDERDRKDLKSPAVNKDRKTGIIMLVVGIVMMIVSFLIR